MMQAKSLYWSHNVKMYKKKVIITVYHDMLKYILLFISFSNIWIFVYSEDVWACRFWRYPLRKQHSGLWLKESSHEWYLVLDPISTLWRIKSEKLVLYHVIKQSNILKYNIYTLKNSTSVRLRGKKTTMRQILDKLEFIILESVVILINWNIQGDF